MGKELIQVVAAVIEQEGEYLLTQRKSTSVLPLLWEFPGGRVEPAETHAAALIREVQGRIGLTVIVGARVGTNLHHYDTYDVQITLYACELPARCKPTPVGVQQVRWVPSDKLGSYEFPPADRDSMSSLLKLSN